MGSDTEPGRGKVVFFLRNVRQEICVSCPQTKDATRAFIYWNPTPIFRREAAESRWRFTYTEGNAVCTKDAEGIARKLMCLDLSSNFLRSPKCFENLCVKGKKIKGPAYFLVLVQLVKWYETYPSFGHHTFYTHIPGILDVAFSCWGKNISRIPLVIHSGSKLDFNCFAHAAPCDW